MWVNSSSHWDDRKGVSVSMIKSGNQEKRKEKVGFSTAENKSGKGKGIQGKGIP